MAEIKPESSRATWGLYLLIALIAVPLVGFTMYSLLGDFGLTLTEITVSALLTTSLVILYSKQTQTLESQRDLLTQELNREARQQHTETLRERVRVWHGAPEKTATDDTFRSTSTNLPSVGYSSFKSAPTGGVDRIGSDDDDFKVVPYQLDGDRYLQDLLNNHAKELDDKKEQIEKLHEKFESARDSFKSEFDAAITQQKEEYALEPAEYFTQWLFEHLVGIRRGKHADFDEMRAHVITQIADDTIGSDMDNNRLWIMAKIGKDSRAVYKVVGQSENWDGEKDRRHELQNEGKQVVESVINEVESEFPYETVEEAASVLDEGEEAIDELRQLLVEYDGRPIFTGDCQYLEEARL